MLLYSDWISTSSLYGVHGLLVLWMAKDALLFAPFVDNLNELS